MGWADCGGRRAFSREGETSWRGVELDRAEVLGGRGALMAVVCASGEGWEEGELDVVRVEGVRNDDSLRGGRAGVRGAHAHPVKSLTGGRREQFDDVKRARDAGGRRRLLGARGRTASEYIGSNMFGVLSLSAPAVEFISHMVSVNSSCPPPSFSTPRALRSVSSTS